VPELNKGYELFKMTAPYENILAPYRRRIEALDEKIVELLAQREAVIREVAEVKENEDIPAVIPQRVDYVRDRAARIGGEKGLDPDYIAELYALIIDHSCTLEDILMGRRDKSKKAS